jgi:hypothetical protein
MAPGAGTVLSDHFARTKLRRSRATAEQGAEIMGGTSFLTYASAFGLMLGGSFMSACGRDAQAMSPENVERQYGVAGAYTGAVTTPDGSLHGTVVPVTLADGRQAQLVIPARPKNDPHGVYLHDDKGLHPVEMSERSSRNEIARAPTVVDTRPDRAHAEKRSWEKDALIIGGSAGAGTLIGAVAGGKKGAAVGATAGGIGGLIYDLASRGHDTSR